MSNTMAKCLQCNKEYKAIRSTSKYCGAKCRKLAFLNKPVSVPEDSVLRDSVLSVPKLSVPLPDRPKTKKPKKASNHRPGDLCPKHKVYYLSCGCHQKQHKPTGQEKHTRQGLYQLYQLERLERHWGGEGYGTGLPLCDWKQKYVSPQNL